MAPLDGWCSLRVGLAVFSEVLRDYERTLGAPSGPYPFLVRHRRPRFAAPNASVTGVLQWPGWR